MGAMLGNGKCFIKSETGEMIAIDNIKEIHTLSAETSDSLTISSEPHEMTIEMGHCAIGLRGILAIFGLPGSNNYRKMRGGIMSRKSLRERKSRRYTE